MDVLETMIQKVYLRPKPSYLLRIIYSNVGALFMRSPLAALTLCLATAGVAQGADAPRQNTLNGLTPLEMVNSCAGLSVALISSADLQSNDLEDHIASFSSLSRAAVRLNGETAGSIHADTRIAQEAVNVTAKRHLARIAQGDPLIAMDTRACQALARTLEDRPDLFDPHS